ncbi:putative phospholipid/glycerol acyltransferase [Actinoplanes missouriensis 431]|uniref:Putative phospholipid/glycerol acyltransferase n=1 Tax=Actinoplanes missouriensis (strain ATCC 14538 / DSM 43046 / CBS 188.64 / JCM 3121 / NBRC 102363 / NCIMB 12654 / NRRL B-3342 / UNCC 431) TaxID=512565 RepID=I0HHJ8_ACTM4|nr:1-acyl-sn-glycerol-3-phosphate acyltransferase [Actinoplanes missouriensis]BAL92485.1 putative phospholipid/glycerol acyltransferase [Actinoplanes missouriensis 431]
MGLPPIWVRRVVIAPLVVLLATTLVTTLPVWLLIALAASPFVPGRLRVPRLVFLIVVYLVWDAVALVALAVTWVASGFGWQIRNAFFQRAHYVMTGWFLRILFWFARWSLHLTIDVVGTDPDTAIPGRPEIVVSRHAGPGDSFTLIHALVNWFAREPRIVLKAALQWDPAVDVLLNRLPNRFISPGRTGTATLEDQIGALATGLDDNDAFVIFPEGGNFTPGRKTKAIARLRASGLDEMADRATHLHNLLPPKPGGLFAAIDAAPDAGVIFVAHTGLDRMVTVSDVWRELPMDKRLVMRFWSVPPEEVPAGEQERVDWLYDWWARIDAWIDDNHPPDFPLPRLQPPRAR